MPSYSGAMPISAKADYAVRALLELAAADDLTAQDDAWVSH